MLNFQNPTLLSYQHQPISWGAGLRYQIQKNFSIQGSIYDLDNGQGVSGIWSGMYDFLTGAKDYSPIYLNDLYFGEGKITAISFDNGNDVRIKNYTANITCYESGNLLNAVTGYYSGIDWTDSFRLDKLDEKFSFSRSETNDQNYTHSISLRINSGSSMPDTPINLAKKFASGLFNHTNLTGFIGGYSDLSIKKYYKETYNLITSECSFDESATILANNSGYYSHTYTHSMQTDEAGITNVSEQGNIKGQKDPIYPAAISGLNEQKPLIYPRCAEVFNAHLSGVYSLNSNPVSVSYGINKFDGTITYNHQYTNDPRLKDRYSHEYTTKIDKKEDNVYTISEEGSVKGFGRPFVDKFQNAQYGYNIIEPQISARLSGIYLSSNPIYSQPLKVIAANYGQDEFKGEISYSRQYSDDSIYVNSNGIKKEIVDVNTSYPTHLVNKFNIINVKEIAQPANTSTPGKRDIKINLLGSRSTSLQNYIDYAKTKVQPYTSITGDDGYLEACSYSFTPNRNEFNMNVSYKFFSNFKQFEDITMT